MSRELIDLDALRGEAVEAMHAIARGVSPPFSINKIGHVVLRVQNLQRSVDFYTNVLGFRISDVYPESMMPGGMVFLRFNSDHHGIALVGGTSSASRRQELHHMAFEVSTLTELVAAREHLRAHKVPIEFEGRRRAGSQIAVEFSDPDGHQLELYWGLDQLGEQQPARPPEQWRPASSIEAAISDPPPGQQPDLHNG